MCEDDEKIIHRLKYYNDETHLAKRIVELQHCIEDLRNQLQQKDSIIKEARKFVDNELKSGRSKDNQWLMGCYDTCKDILEILDKEKI